MPLPTDDQTPSTPVIAAIAVGIVVLLVLAVLALRGAGDDGVDLGASSGSEPSVPPPTDASSPPATTADQTAEPTPDVGEQAGPAAQGTAAPADAGVATTPAVPLADPQGVGPPPGGGTAGASEGSGSADEGGEAGLVDAAPTDGSLPAGTCIDDDGRASDTASATPVDCAVAHTGEVFATTTVTLPPDAAHPGADVLEADTRGLCQGPAFEDYVGTPHDRSALFTYALFPTEESWAAGDRAVACVAFHPMERTEGSVRGSGR